MSSAGFNALASRYDELWTRSAVGRSQRAAVWRHIDPLFRAGDSILDLGCGTGEDALHFMRAGVDVRAIDSSPEMVRVAAARGVNATLLSIKDAGRLAGGAWNNAFDGAISNFGAFNCVADLGRVRAGLARMVRPGGFLAICILGRVCAWETVWYLLRGKPRKAFRRWTGAHFSSSFGLHVFYPGARRLREAFTPDFKLLRWYGIGLLVPPSYVPGLPGPVIDLLDRGDRRIAHCRGLRALADHRLFIFTRN